MKLPAGGTTDQAGGGETIGFNPRPDCTDFSPLPTTRNNKREKEEEGKYEFTFRE